MHVLWLGRAGKSRYLRQKVALEGVANRAAQIRRLRWAWRRPTGQNHAAGRCKTPVENSVDVERATWTNTIRDSEFIAVWEDPDFDPAQSAFYYVRVIEIPTPRLTAYEAVRFGIKMPDGVPMTTRERADTSPIW